MTIAIYFIHQANEKLNLVVRSIAPRTLRKTGIISLGTVAILSMAYSLYQKINIPPKHMRHLPYIGSYSFIKDIFTNELYENYSKKRILPLIGQGSDGLYMRFAILNWTLFISNPVAVKQVLLKPEHVFPKKPILAPKGSLADRFIGGPNILLTSGADWRKHKKITNPAFQRSMPVKAFGELTTKMFQVIESEQSVSVDILELFERWTLDAIGVAGFDFDFKSLGDKDNKWVTNYNTIKGGLTNPLYFLLPMLDTKYLSYCKDRQKIHAVLTELLDNIDGIIEDKRKTVKEKKQNNIADHEKDLLTLMIESEEMGASQGLSNEELKSNLCIFFLAGHDTTATTLALAMYELAVNPEIQEKARQEAICILGDTPEDIIPSLEQTKQLSYLNMVIKETLRRHPPAYTTTPRVVQEDMLLLGNYIPKGTEWSIDIHSLHHNPEIWNDPYKFDPDRFLPDGEADNQEGIAWVPFSYGQRQCTGMNFSLAEQRVVLSMLLRKYTWTLPKDSPHTNMAQKRRVAFSLVLLAEKMNLNFEKRY